MLGRDDRKVFKVLTKNKWLIEMWEEFEKARNAFYKNVNILEKKYQRKYNKEKDDVFFAWLEGDVIGIDWKDVNTGRKGAILIHDSQIKEFKEKMER